MLTNRFDPALPATSSPRRARIEPIGGRACFISGAFLGGPFAHGWRLERGAVLDIGPHLLDMLEAGLGEIVAVQAAGDPLGWVSVNCTHASGATSGVSMCCTAATPTGRTEVEVYSPTGVAFYDARAVDHRARADRIRTDLVAVAGGAEHPANVGRALHLQRLIADIEAQLRSEHGDNERVTRARVRRRAPRAARPRRRRVRRTRRRRAVRTRCSAARRCESSHPDDPELAVAGLVARHRRHRVPARPRRPRAPRRGARRAAARPRGSRGSSARTSTPSATSSRPIPRTAPGLSPRSVETLHAAGRGARRRGDRRAGRRSRPRRDPRAAPRRRSGQGPRRARRRRSTRWRAAARTDAR